MRFSEGIPTAEPALADRLNYRVFGRTIELALSAPPRPQNLYELPANDRDARSFRESPPEHNRRLRRGRGRWPSWLRSSGRV